MAASLHDSYFYVMIKTLDWAAANIIVLKWAKTYVSHLFLYVYIWIMQNRIRIPNFCNYGILLTNTLFIHHELARKLAALTEAMKYSQPGHFYITWTLLYRSVSRRWYRTDIVFYVFVFLHNKSIFYGKKLFLCRCIPSPISFYFSVDLAIL